MTDHICGACEVEMDRTTKRHEVKKFKNVETIETNGGKSYRWVEDGTRKTGVTTYQCPRCHIFVYATQLHLVKA